MTCKECINNDICHKVCSKDTCSFFKDKSIFVKLPCKIGDDIYEAFFKKVIKSHVVQIVVFSVGIWVYAQNSSELHMDRFKLDDFGKYVFTNKQNAENAIKERENNDRGRIP